jgi:hypothetical protein
MKWRFVVVSTTALWAVMTALLIKREILPYFEYQSAPSYGTMLAKVEAPIYRRYEVFLGGTRVGDAEELISFESDPSYTIEDRMRFDLSALSRFASGKIVIRSKTEVNLDFELTRFFAQMSLGVGMKLTINAFRDGDVLKVSYNGLGIRDDVPLEFPRGTMLSHNFVPYHGNRYLAVGQKWKMQMIEFDITGKPRFVPAFVSVEERLVETWQGREEDVYRIEIKERPNQERVNYMAWVTRDGTVIKSLSTIGSIEITTTLVEQRALTELESLSPHWQIPIEEEP